MLSKVLCKSLYILVSLKDFATPLPSSPCLILKRKLDYQVAALLLRLLVITLTN
jgi:hypothetical protein